jgi:hypothetical protein
MPLSTDTTNAAAVAEMAERTFGRLFPGADPKLVRQLFADTDDIFNGRYLDYQAVDLKYHDYRHTLQVTVCFIDLLVGRHAAGEPPALSARHFEIGLAAALLHDSGYLKTRTDTTGTGAKYTFCHVLRSCALAATFLPTRGFNLDEIETVLGAIRRTGPAPIGGLSRFRSAEEQFLSCAVASCDYLAQMAASDYPDELDILYAEFKESDDFVGLPAHRRTFQSAADLATRTPAFWKKIVKPKLEKEFGNLYRLLALPNGTHPYLDAIEKNLALIAERARSTAT